MSVRFPPGRPPRRPRQPVAAAKIIPFGLDVAQVPAQAVEFVPSLRGLGAEFADRGGRRLANGREPTFEIEAGQALLVEVQFVEEHAMGTVLLRLHAFDDPAFDVIEHDRVRDGRLFGATFGSEPSDREVRRELADVERRKNLQRRAIVVLLPLEATNQSGECGAYCQFRRSHGSTGLPRPALHIAHDSNNLATKQAEMESQYSRVPIFEPPVAAAGIRAPGSAGRHLSVEKMPD